MEAAVFASEEREETAKLSLPPRGHNPRMLNQSQVDEPNAYSSLTNKSN